MSTPKKKSEIILQKIRKKIREIDRICKDPTMFEKIFRVVEDMVAEIKHSENIGRQIDKMNILELKNMKIAGIWMLSGPGSFYRDIKETDVAYISKPWARGMDRSRHLVVEKIYRSLDKYSAPYIYNGTNEENKDLMEACANGDLKIPVKNLHIISDDNVRNTSTQIERIIFPPMEEGKLIIVSHAPHLSRALRTLARYETIPQKHDIVLIPLATEDSGKDEYMYMEIEATLFYHFVAQIKQTELAPYPHNIIRLA